MNNNTENIDSMREDVLREIANIGAGHAATALSQMLDRVIEQSLPDVKLVPLQEMPNLLGGAEKVAVAGMLSLEGDFSGFLLMILNFQQAEKIISMVSGESVEEHGEDQGFTEMEQSVLCETVNIIGGSYLSAIMEFTNLSITMSIPYLCIDMIGAIMNVAAVEVGQMGDFAIMFQSQLFNESERIIGDLLLIPDENSCDTMMRALGIDG